MKKLDGKIVLITGGTSGIGRATAELFQTEGARVIVTGRGTAPTGLNQGLTFIKCNTAVLDETAAMVSKVRDDFGRLDVLFVNAGTAKFRPIEEADEGFFDDHFNTNVKGAYFTIKHVLPLMGNGGSILLNASVAARIGRPNISVYAATKAALVSIGKTLAAEVAPRGIRVNILSPGPVYTPLFDKMELPDQAVQELQNRMAESTVFRRLAQADEIARAALFLASPDSSYMTGAEMQVDGGIL
jgi:NAD(P)-dependent dehydrogenase (short-subunit alcohol dehydrogenase family)